MAEKKNTTNEGKTDQPKGTINIDPKQRLEDLGKTYHALAKFAGSQGLDSPSIKKSLKTVHSLFEKAEKESDNQQEALQKIKDLLVEVRQDLILDNFVKSHGSAFNFKREKVKTAALGGKDMERARETNKDFVLQLPAGYRVTGIDGNPPKSGWCQKFENKPGSRELRIGYITMKKLNGATITLTSPNDEEVYGTMCITQIDEKSGEYGAQISFKNNKEVEENTAPAASQPSVSVAPATTLPSGPVAPTITPGVADLTASPPKVSPDQKNDHLNFIRGTVGRIANNRVDSEDDYKKMMHDVYCYIYQDKTVTLGEVQDIFKQAGFNLILEENGNHKLSKISTTPEQTPAVKPAQAPSTLKPKVTKSSTSPKQTPSDTILTKWHATNNTENPTDASVAVAIQDLNKAKDQLYKKVNNHELGSEDFIEELKKLIVVSEQLSRDMTDSAIVFNGKKKRFERKNPIIDAALAMVKQYKDGLAGINGEFTLKHPDNLAKDINDLLQSSQTKFSRDTLENIIEESRDIKVGGNTYSLKFDQKTQKFSAVPTPEAPTTRPTAPARKTPVKPSPAVLPTPAPAISPTPSLERSKKTPTTLNSKATPETFRIDSEIPERIQNEICSEKVLENLKKNPTFKAKGGRLYRRVEGKIYYNSTPDKKKTWGELSNNKSDFAEINEEFTEIKLVGAQNSFPRVFETVDGRFILDEKATLVAPDKNGVFKFPAKHPLYYKRFGEKLEQCDATGVPRAVYINNMLQSLIEEGFEAKYEDGFRGTFFDSKAVSMKLPQLGSIRLFELSVVIGKDGKFGIECKAEKETPYSSVREVIEAAKQRKEKIDTFIKDVDTAEKLTTNREKYLAYGKLFEQLNEVRDSFSNQSMDQTFLAQFANQAAWAVVENHMKRDPQGLQLEDAAKYIQHLYESLSNSQNPNPHQVDTVAQYYKLQFKNEGKTEAKALAIDLLQKTIGKSKETENWNQLVLNDKNQVEENEKLLKTLKE